MKKSWLLWVLFSMFAVSSLYALNMKDRMIYFIMTDRFYNGNTANDNGDRSHPEMTATTPGGTAEVNWKKYWGGDIQGLIDKLDYLKDMGVGAVWVSPLADNVEGVDSKGEAPYHGYWVKDYYRPDEHYGTWADVRALAKALHARNMKFILDITLNDSNPDNEMEYGALYKNGTFLANYQSDDWTYYHHYDDPSTWQWGDRWKDINLPLFNLADFNQGSEVLDNYLIGAAEKWLDAGVDAFRIDAIKHIEPSFIDKFTSAVNNYAINTLGRTNSVFYVGEWFNAGAGDSDSVAFANSHENTSLFDFKLRGKIENVMGNTANMNDLQNHLLERENQFDHPENQVLFLDNHDMTRMLVALTYYYGIDENTARKRMQLAMALIFTLRGIPCVYYGTEQYAETYLKDSNGNMGANPFNRQAQPSFNENSDMYKEIKKLSEIRKSHVALQSGTYKQKYVNNDILVFERSLNGDVVDVAVNRGNAANITVSGLGLAAGDYVNALGSEHVSVSSGKATFSLAPNSVQIISGNAPIVPSGTYRTVVFIFKETHSGQDIFIRGGHDADLVSQGYFSSMDEPITYNNTLNPTTAFYKANDRTLDWFSDSALDWTCSPGSSQWHEDNNIRYETSGYGIDTENQWGMHWWKFDVNMHGNIGNWFEFKAFLRENGNEQWENNISQSGTPYSTINHWGKKGYITRVSFGQSWAEFIPLY